MLHVIENHEHTVCISKTEKHIHTNEIDCDLLHRPYQTYAFEIPSRLDVIPTHFYTSIIEEAPQLITVGLQNKKNPRGPPFFTV